MTGIRLNLGCGAKRYEGYINVDKFGEPDVRHDLETFPWPWPDDSVGEIRLCHVLEHLGPTPGVYLQIFKEMYRVCQAGARIDITVPHPRHDFFLGDPTHVRPITPLGLQLFSQAANKKWIAQGASNSPLGLYLEVDFELLETHYRPSSQWHQLHPGPVDLKQLLHESTYYNNLIAEIQMVLRVVKE